MNIMYIFNDMTFAGAGQSLLDTISGIRDKVNPIIVVRFGSNVKERFEKLGVKCYQITFNYDFVRIGKIDKDVEALDLKQSYNAADELIPIIEQEKIDLIHINSSSSYFAAIAALMTGVPYIWHIRELLEEQFNCEYINKSIIVNLMQNASKRIAISDYVKNEFDKKYGLDTVRMYDGIDIERFRNAIDVKRKYTNSFLVAAEITPEKGQWDAIRAVEVLINKGYGNTQLKIVGHCKSGYLWAIKKYIHIKKLENNIYILDFVNDLADLRKAASYAITCSQNEALGRVTIEAMLAGNIVIGARSGGTIEIIGKDEERGFFYELNDYMDLANTLEKVIQIPSKRKSEIAIIAQKYAEKTFSREQYCNNLEDIYNDNIINYKQADSSEDINILTKQFEDVKKNRIQNTTDQATQKIISAYNLVCKWLEIKQKGYSLKNYFTQNKIESIIIYGMSDLGRYLYDELENGPVNVVGLIDRNPNGMERILNFVKIDSLDKELDTIVVTVAFEEQIIINNLIAQGYKKVIGLSEIIRSTLIEMPI